MTHTHTHSIGLLRTRDRPVEEASDNTQHSQETDIRAPEEIRTRNPSKLYALDCAATLTRIV
jgi:hypothetical protein